MKRLNLKIYFKKLREVFFIDIYIKNISMKNLFNNISQEEKNRILEMHSGKKNVISEQIDPWSNILSGSSQKAVRQFFDSCGNSRQSPNNTNEIVDRIYKAVQGPGTDEDSIFGALTATKDFNTFCSAVKNYKTTYGTDLYSDLDGDIDEETVWSQISKILRGLSQSSPQPAQVSPSSPQPAQVSPQENQVSQNAKKCGWLKTDGSADVEGYRNSNWKCPKPAQVSPSTPKPRTQPAPQPN